MLKTKLIDFKNNSYTINFPNVGQLQDIEAFKITYSNGRYVDLMNSGLKMHEQMLDITDAVSYLSVLCPTLMKDLGVKSWRSLDPFMAKELVKCYKNDFIPWFKPILEDLYKFDEPEIEESDESKNK